MKIKFFKRITRMDKGEYALSFSLHFNKYPDNSGDFQIIFMLMKWVISFVFIRDYPENFR